MKEGRKKTHKNSLGERKARIVNPCRMGDGRGMKKEAGRGFASRVAIG
jgi:hypothetical protein